MIKEYIDQNKDRFLNELFDLLRIPSISADKDYAEEVNKTANFVRDRLIEAGAEKVEVCATGGYPIVYGEKIIDPKLPTVLVYGHYDVQPADPIHLWTNPPFEPIIKNGNIYARGSADDKGQFFMHVKAFELMLQNNMLPCNIKFMIEGEEEVGSSNLDGFLMNNKEKLKADCVLVSDTSMIANDIPSITTGLRGLSYVEVEVTGPNRDLHSGVYGGGVANPVNVNSFINQLELIEKDLKKGKKTDKGLWFRFFKNDTGATTIQNISSTLNVECYKGSTDYRNKESLLECVMIALTEISLEVNFS
jgi:acetylornithine deacetylase/succinyl-diaminopimelate desuccinylase-like protein